MSPETKALLKEALESGYDLAVAQASNIHEIYKGYKPERHKAADEEVQLFKDALEALEKE